MGLKENARRYAEVHGMATIPLAGKMPRKKKRKETIPQNKTPININSWQKFTPFSQVNDSDLACSQCQLGPVRYIAKSIGLDRERG